MEDLESTLIGTPQRKQAEAVYDTVCRALEGMGMKILKDRNEDGSLVAVSRVISDEFKLTLILMVRHQIDTITLIAGLPLTVPLKLRMWMAAAVCTVNGAIFEGNFNYDMEAGSVLYRLTENYLDTQIGEKQIRSMVTKAVRTIDIYGIKMRRFCEEIVTLEEFIEDVKRKK